MNNHDENFEHVDAATDAMKSQPVPDGPSEDLLASTVEAMRTSSLSTNRRKRSVDKSSSHDDSPQAPRRQSRREMMLRFARYGTLGTAASVTILLIGSLIFSSVTSQNAFAQVLENIRNAGAVKYVMTQKLGQQQPIRFDCSLSGPKMRMESPGFQIMLVDTTTRDSMTLILPQKLAIKGKMEGDPAAKALSLPEVLAEITEEHATRVKTVMQDGKEVDVYDVSKLPAFLGQGDIGDDEVFRVWVDHQSQLPVRVSIQLHRTFGGQKSTSEMEMTDFQWDPQLDDDTFDMVVPDGFEVKDASEFNPSN